MVVPACQDLVVQVGVGGAMSWRPALGPWRLFHARPGLARASRARPGALPGPPGQGLRRKSKNRSNI